MQWYTEQLVSFDDRVAVVDGDRTYTYRTLSERIATYFNELQTTVKPGGVVALHSDYSFESIALFLALYEHRCIIVPIATNVVQEVSERIDIAGCDVLITLNGTMTVAPLPHTQAHPMISQLQEHDHAGLILFSSGSTGKPKAMIHDLDNLIDSYRGKKPKSMNFLLFLMFDHIGGLNTLFNVLSMGASVIIPKNRSIEEICGLIEKHKIRILPSSPTFLNMILMGNALETYDLSSLRMITYGTEAMPESLLKRLQHHFPKVKFLQTFGTSETGISTTASKSSDSTYMKIDDPDTEYKIVGGELWLRSKTQILGYLNAPSGFTDDGWFMTSDLVEEAEDGYIKIIGRNKEMINVGGEKVLPVEVESVLLGMKGVEDAMVFSEANAITGQSVCAQLVMPLETSAREAKRKVRDYCKDKLDNYKIPTKIKLVSRTNYSERFKKMRLGEL
jgi:acyl-coenzyme A synthetase/AMP-(fatty) acid ligase